MTTFTGKALGTTFNFFAGPITAAVHVLRTANFEYTPKQRNDSIKDALQPTLEKAGIKKDVIFDETNYVGFGGALGTNFFKNSDIAIIISSGFHKVDKEACFWTLKHEIGHMKHHDTVTFGCVSGISQLAAGIFGWTFTSLTPLPLLALAFTVGEISKVVFEKHQEGKADDFAIENASDEELKGGRRAFIVGRENYLVARSQKSWKQIYISKTGDNWGDTKHPFITSRIKKIEDALHKRGVKLDTEEENKKIDKLWRYLNSMMPNDDTETATADES